MVLRKLKPIEDRDPYAEAVLEAFDRLERNALSKSACSCGQPVLIEHNARTCRADGKRIFYPDEADTGWCAFRCKRCHQQVSETVPGAEYGVTANAGHESGRLGRNNLASRLPAGPLDELVGHGG